MSKLRAKRIVLALLVLILAAGAYFVAKNQYLQLMSIGTGSKAKILCSAVFLSGRDPAIVEAEDLGFHPLFKIFKAKVDYDEQSVTCSLWGTGLFKAKAVYREGIGAVLLNGVTEEAVREWPAPALDPAIEQTDPEAVDWPTGDRLALIPPSDTIDLVRIRAAADRLFIESDPNHILRTRALLVLHDGCLVYEKYGPGITKDTRLLSWSTVKSVTSALVGILVGQGKLNLKDPAPVSEWAGGDDPRRTITLDQLMRMSSGLEWFEAYADRPVSDVNAMLFRKADMAVFAVSKPLAARPETVWNYSSGTANIIQRIIRKAFESDEEYWNFPRRALFDKIGMRNAVWERDASGTFVGSSYLYATARDFARFGLLCLNDGVWLGERILPEGWMAYSTTPTLAAPQGQYGAFFWLNKGDPGKPETRPYPKLPEDTYFALGYQGQTIAVLPSRKLVVVRLGMTYDDNWGGMNVFLPEILAAIK
ncbi:MAG: serine hydrolase [Candidatus Aminicenantes bacterium]|nr:serine hydrolase [Candidatus Aminicenantes bacterium]